tara:strand:- start:102 stop:293 length:192 start_codon:yes stop_codon:yes gene_type:complete
MTPKKFPIKKNYNTIQGNIVDIVDVKAIKVFRGNPMFLRMAMKIKNNIKAIGDVIIQKINDLI